ncbi:hypothetical protein BD289DRAFT_285495 [Coniella lustricola]|uniref:Ecp2 effector protein-like domain-containing protein n=1 Tax=Coniella lustricola TaxID=2025994 RepID=A0A2T3AK62_9PEZI|nr:hypothetical protein BD289DRAFT_285495 [Coniella lustricola]
MDNPVFGRMVVLLLASICLCLLQDSTSPPHTPRTAPLIQPSGPHPSLTHDRRDFVWTDTEPHLQNLCGDSTFTESADSTSSNAETADNENEKGADTQVANADVIRIEDCRAFVNTMKARNGYWLVTGFSGEGAMTTWEEFATLASCKMGVRRRDDGTHIVPIGNQDVADILNSVMEKHGEGVALPPYQGNMTCHKGSTVANVEWRIYNN